MSLSVLIDLNRLLSVNKAIIIIYSFIIYIFTSDSLSSDEHDLVLCICMTRRNEYLCKKTYSTRVSLCPTWLSFSQRWHKYLVYKYKYECIGLPLAMQMKLNKIHESWLS